MALFIGQRKNVWLMDYEKQTHKLVTKASLVESENMLWDIMSDYVDGHSIDISFIDGQVVLLLDDKEKKIISKDKFPWREVEKIQPHYGMEPNI